MLLKIRTQMKFRCRCIEPTSQRMASHCAWKNMFACTDGSAWARKGSLAHSGPTCLWVAPQQLAYTQFCGQLHYSLL